MHQQALSLCEKVLGKENPSTLARMNNLALVLKIRGEYDEAEEIHRGALNLMEKVFGKKHPSTLISKSNLASLLEEQHKSDEASSLYESDDEGSDHTEVSDQSE